MRGPRCASLLVTTCCGLLLLSLTSSRVSGLALLPNHRSRVKQHETTRTSPLFDSKKASDDVIEDKSELERQPRDARQNPILWLCQTYMKLCETKPLRTKALTQSVIGGIGSILSQYTVAISSKAVFVIDWSQVHAFMISGLVFEGPFFHLWYGRLWAFGTWLEDKLHVPSSSSIKTCAQVALDQTLGVLLFFPTYFFLFEIIQSMVTWKAPNLYLAQTRLCAEFLGVIRTNYMVWPVANWIIFKYVPRSLRVLATSIVAILWNAFLCSRVAGIA